MKTEATDKIPQPSISIKIPEVKLRRGEGEQVITFEIKNGTWKQWQVLRDKGFKLEQLDPVYTNASCEEERADDLREALEEMGLEHRMV